MQFALPGLINQLHRHTFRRSFITHLIQDDSDIQHLRFWEGVRIALKVLGHKDAQTTIIYTHTIWHGGLAVKKPVGLIRTSDLRPGIRLEFLAHLLNLPKEHV
jgi:hypothetical protein